jgi:energy-coupling factor transporter ATP-binding protein EcfA2
VLAPVRYDSWVIEPPTADSSTPAAPDTPPDGPTAWYQDRRDRFRAEATILAAQAARLANVRLLLFLGLAVAAIWAYWADPPLSYVLWAVAAGLTVWFVVQVRRYRRVERRRRHLAGLADLADEALLRIARDWQQLPLRHEGRAEPTHPYANDLDLLGHGSLLHLLESTGTRLGESTLRGWLLAAATKDGLPVSRATADGLPLAAPAGTPVIAPVGDGGVSERQAAVGELAPLAEWREELVWRGRATGTPSPDPEPFLAWAEGDRFLASKRALVWGARISPPLFWILLLAHMGGLLAWPLWIVPVLGNLLLGWQLVGTAVSRLNQVRYFAGALGAYADALDHLAQQSFAAPALQRLQAALDVEGHAAAAEIRRLHKIVRLAQPATSMVYPVIELTTLWNVHVLDLLERWQARSGGRARGWLAALGEAEALAALARLRHDNPTWTLPDLDPEATRIEAEELGHPLLAGQGRIANDLTLGPPGTFLLVTGSNMSGKSTLLRALGVNAVLAQAGGPVCATAFRLPPLELWTAMRISDSLERGVSFFMAELERLRDVVGAARDAGPAEPTAPPRVLYLLDEILQGTNTAERQIAARRVIRLLLRCRSIGAVSTHDLTLADAPDLGAAAQAIHLTELVVDGPEGARMTFDYRIRQGIARSTNALRLLDMVGLVEPEHSGPEQEVAVRAD